MLLKCKTPDTQNFCYEVFTRLTSCSVAFGMQALKTRTGKVDP